MLKSPPIIKPLIDGITQCARLALRHIPREETRPLKAIETAEAWTRGQATLEQVRKAGHAAERTTEYGDSVYMAAQAARAAAWAVYAEEDGACFRLAQAASEAAHYTGWAASQEIFEMQLAAHDHSSGAGAARDRAEKETLRKCAELVRRTLNVPNGLTDELPIYSWVKSWHRNSSGKRTGRMNHIPIAISRNSPNLDRTNRNFTEKPLSPALRIATVLSVLAAGWFLVGALERHPATYYTNLRWLICLTAVMLIWRGDIQKSLKHGYLLVPIAILFNPIIPVQLHGKRMDILQIWHTIDVATAAVLVLVLALMEAQLWVTEKHRRPKLGDFCRFKPKKTSETNWAMWQKRLIDLTAGEIVKVVGTAEHGMCYVNKPGKCPVLATMELVDTEWLRPVNRNFKECDYCGAIDHATSGCPYRGKIPYGCKEETSQWHVEDGKMVVD